MERSEIGRAPISAENPAGQDVRYEPDFEALTDEINKLSSPTAIAGIDWQKVVSLAEKILSEQSKHLTVSCYLCLGLLHTEGLHGLADGLKILHDLLEEYWDSMFPLPKRKNARINTLAWWNEKLQALLENFPEEKWEQGERTTLLDEIMAIDGIIGEKLEDGPSLRPLQEKLAALLTTEPAVTAAEEDSGPGESEVAAAADPEPVPLPAGTVTQAAAPEQPAAAQVPAGEGDQADALKYFEQGQDFLATSATLLFARDMSDFLAYRLNRMIAWFGVDSLPPATDGKTMLEPPDEQLRTLLAGLHASSDWEELLQAAESRIRQYLFWLDLDFWVYSALSHLNYSAAAQAVADDTLLFITRLKGVEKYGFADGTPFAGEDTLDWLDALATGGGDSGGGVPVMEIAPDQDSADTLQAAVELNRDKGQAAMVTFLQEKISTAVSVRSRFQLYLALCQLLEKEKHSPLLPPFVDEMLALVDQYHLEQWEPDLALQAMTVAYTSMSKTDRKKNEEKLHDLFGRITLLNAQKSLEIS